MIRAYYLKLDLNCLLQRGEQRQWGEQRGGDAPLQAADEQHQHWEQADDGEGAGPAGRARLEEQEVEPDGHDQQALRSEGWPGEEVNS